MSTLHGKTLLITGASRGIGKTIGLRAAADGANVVVVARTTEPHPKLPGTIHTAAQEIEAAGGKALACVADVRFEDQVQAAIDKAAQAFGGIDILVNNAGAIQLTATPDTEMKRFDLMHAISSRATFMTSKLCLPHLRAAANPHILNIAPPLTDNPRWFAPHLAWSLAKYGMSLCVLGMAAEFKRTGIAVNALWPRTLIATAAVQNLLGGDAAIRRSRTPAIVADAAHAILTRDARRCTGHFYLDDEVLTEEGITDLTRYAVAPGNDLQPDLFVDETG